MKRRLATRVIDRIERFQWVPDRLARWAFDYIFEQGTPVTVVGCPRVVVDGGHPLIAVNPSWTSTTGTSISYTFTSTWPSA